MCDVIEVIFSINRCGYLNKLRGEIKLWQEQKLVDKKLLQKT